MPLPPKAELQWWYQFYSATERGRDGYDKYRRDFSKLIWQLASSKWERWRLDLVEGESKYDDLEGHRPQSAAGGAAGLRPSDCRCRCGLSSQEIRFGEEIRLPTPNKAIAT
jgi:hypothetical protein